MNNADMSAMPIPEEGVAMWWFDPKDTQKGTIEASGLTKRERVAAMALQGMLADDGGYTSSADLAGYAVECADALL